jgi:hypothetical protein
LRLPGDPVWDSQTTTVRSVHFTPPPEAHQKIQSSLVIKLFFFLQFVYQKNLFVFPIFHDNFRAGE